MGGMIFLALQAENGFLKPSSNFRLSTQVDTSMFSGLF